VAQAELDDHPVHAGQPLGGAVDRIALGNLLGDVELESAHRPGRVAARRRASRPHGERGESTQDPPQFCVVPSSIRRRMTSLSSRSLIAANPATGGAMTMVAAHTTVL